MKQLSFPEDFASVRRNLPWDDRAIAEHLDSHGSRLSI
jgi:hypothetical protein